MIWKYIVTWVVYNTVSPPSVEKFDAYGRKMVNMQLAYCSIKTDTLRREFETKEAVNVFIDGMKPNALNGVLLNPNNLQLIKIDSVKISPVKL